MSDWTSIVRDLGMGGGVLAGVVIAVRALKNGKHCPAEPVLAEYHEDLVKSRVVQEGLIEATNRNTAAAERQTDLLGKILLKESSNG